jgi:membrane protease YdiL (CAAX protease family)
MRPMTRSRPTDVAGAADDATKARSPAGLPIDATVSTLSQELATSLGPSVPGVGGEPRHELGPGVLGAIGWTVLVVILMPLLTLIPTAWPGSDLSRGTLGSLCGLGGVGLLLVVPGVRARLRALELPGTARAGLRQLTPLLVVAAAYGALLLAAKGVPGPAAFAYAVALSAMAGASEEVWRGLALRALGGRQRPRLALIATSLVFGALHLAALSGPSLLHALVTTLIGAAFGLAIVGGVPVLVVAAVHAGYDLLLLATVGVPYDKVIDEAESKGVGLASLMATAPLALAAVLCIVRGVHALRERTPVAGARAPQRTG